MIAIGFGEVLGCCFTPLNDFIVTLGVFEKNCFLTKKKSRFCLKCAWGRVFKNIDFLHPKSIFSKILKLSLDSVRLWGFIS